MTATQLLTKQTETQTIIESIKRCGTAALDLETYSPHLGEKTGGLIYWVGHIRLISIATAEGSWVLDLGLYYEHIRQYADFLHELSNLLEAKAYRIGGHNFLFDMCFLAYMMQSQFGREYLNFQSCWDTQLCSKWYWAGTRLPHGLGYLAERALGIEVDKSDQKADYGALVMDDEHLEYSRKDAAITLQLYNWFKGHDKPYQTLYGQLCAAIPAFASMMLNGFPVDIDLMKEYLEKHKRALNPIAESLAEVFPDMSLTPSPAKLKAVVYEKYGVELLDTTKKTLESVVDRCPALEILLAGKKLAKQIGTIEGMIDGYRDGCVYSNYNMTATTATGRTSSSKFGRKYGLNNQNLPKPYDKKDANYALGSVRDCFRAPEGYSLIISDYSAAHARLAAALSEETVLIEDYKNGIDSHLRTATRLSFLLRDKLVEVTEDKTEDVCTTPPEEKIELDVPLYPLVGQNDDYNEAWFDEDLDKRYSAIKADYKAGSKLLKDLRGKAKTVFFSCLNLCGKTKLSVILGTSVEIAAQVLEEFWSLYPKLKEFCYSRKNFLLPGVVLNHVDYRPLRMPWGTLRYFEVFDGMYGKSCKINDLVSAHWLGCEGISMFASMASLHQAFKANPEWDARLVVNCHDELVVMCRDAYKLEVSTLVGDTMVSKLEYWIKGFPATEKSAPEEKFATCWSEK